MSDAYISPPGPGGPAVDACSACAHPWAEHDQIGARYCAATMAGHHDRGCVCTVLAAATSDSGTKTG